MSRLRVGGDSTLSSPLSQQVASDPGIMTFDTARETTPNSKSALYGLAYRTCYSTFLSANVALFCGPPKIRNYHDRLRMLPQTLGARIEGRDQP